MDTDLVKLTICNWKLHATRLCNYFHITFLSIYLHYGFLVEFNAIKDDASICSTCTDNFCLIQYQS